MALFTICVNADVDRVSPDGHGLRVPMTTREKTHTQSESWWGDRINGAPWCQTKSRRVFRIVDGNPSCNECSRQHLMTIRMLMDLVFAT